jgi:hypothetical protein
MIRVFFLEGNYSVGQTALLLQPLFIKFPLVANKALKTRPYVLEGGLLSKQMNEK